MDAARYLEDGKLTIFRRDGTYYARLRISPGRKYFWRSLKTSDEQTAVRLGRRLLFQIEQRANQGLPPKSKLFSAVIDQYIRFRERDHALFITPVRVEFGCHSTNGMTKWLRRRRLPRPSRRVPPRSLPKVPA